TYGLGERVYHEVMARSARDEDDAGRAGAHGRNARKAEELAGAKLVVADLELPPEACVGAGSEEPWSRHRRGHITRAGNGAYRALQDGRPGDQCHALRSCLIHHLLGNDHRLAHLETEDEATYERDQIGQPHVVAQQIWSGRALRPKSRQEPIVPLTELLGPDLQGLLVVVAHGHVGRQTIAVEEPTLGENS